MISRNWLSAPPRLSPLSYTLYSAPNHPNFILHASAFWPDPPPQVSRHSCHFRITPPRSSPISINIPRVPFVLRSSDSSPQDLHDAASFAGIGQAVVEIWVIWCSDINWVIFRRSVFHQAQVPLPSISTIEALPPRFPHTPRSPESLCWSSQNHIFCHYRLPYCPPPPTLVLLPSGSVWQIRRMRQPPHIESVVPCSPQE